MTRTSLDSLPCSWARAIDIVGDKWTLMILRDAFAGVSVFSDFRRNLGVAPNILSDRLDRLVTHGILDKRPVRPGVERYDYRLTARGKALFPVLTSLGQWGDKWIFGSDGEPVRVLDRKNRAPIQSVAVTARDGRYLEADDVVYAPGPGAPDVLRRALECRDDADET